MREDIGDPAKFWIYQDTGAGCWGYYLFDKEGNFLIEHSDFETEEQARDNVLFLLKSVASYKPTTSHYTITESESFKGRNTPKYQVNWFDHSGKVYEVDEVFLTLKAAQEHGRIVYAHMIGEMFDLPKKFTEKIYTENLAALILANTESVDQSRSSMHMTGTARIKSFDEKWQEGIRAFLPNVELA
jgi:hypothetical protein